MLWRSSAGVVPVIAAGGPLTATSQSHQRGQYVRGRGFRALAQK